MVIAGTLHTFITLTSSVWQLLWPAVLLDNQGTSRQWGPIQAQHAA
jgi:hypothetical protein